MMSERVLNGSFGLLTYSNLKGFLLSIGCLMTMGPEAVHSGTGESQLLYSVSLERRRDVTQHHAATLQSSNGRSA